MRIRTRNRSTPLAESSKRALSSFYLGAPRRLTGCKCFLRQLLITSIGARLSHTNQGQKRPNSRIHLRCNARVRRYMLFAYASPLPRWPSSACRRRRRATVRIARRDIQSQSRASAAIWRHRPARPDAVAPRQPTTPQNDPCKSGKSTGNLCADIARQECNTMSMRCSLNRRGWCCGARWEQKVSNCWTLVRRDGPQHDSRSGTRLAFVLAATAQLVIRRNVFCSSCLAHNNQLGAP